MNNLKKYFLLFIWLILICYNSYSFAWGVITLHDPTWDIEASSIDPTWNDLENDIENVWLWILWIIKLIVQWILILFIVYTWIQMILSMWSNEEELSSAKRQLRYAIVWVFFINIPQTLFNIFNTRGAVWWDWRSATSFTNSWTTNLLVTWDFSTIIGMIIHFLEVAIFFAAIFMFILAWIQILTSRWRDERVKEWKNKILYWIWWLVFIWIIEAWKSIIFEWNAVWWVWLFNTLLQIILFFAWVTVIFFLSLAWYYAITSAWDEEKIKKSKSIVINVLIGILILTLSYTFLIDLLTL